MIFYLLCRSFIGNIEDNSALWATIMLYLTLSAVICQSLSNADNPLYTQCLHI